MIAFFYHYRFIIKLQDIIVGKKRNGLIDVKEKSHLLLLSSAPQHPLSQELSPFLQLLVFMPVHLPPPYL